MTLWQLDGITGGAGRMALVMISGAARDSAKRESTMGGKAHRRDSDAAFQHRARNDARWAGVHRGRERRSSF